MGKVVGASIVKSIQTQLDHFEDKKFNLHYVEKVFLHAPKDLTHQSYQKIVFFLQSIKNIEDQLKQSELLTSAVSYQNVAYKQENGNSKEELYIKITLNSYEEVLTKGKVQITVGMK